MGSTIYTRHGDGGETSLSDGSRVPKHGLRVEAYGAIDEANSTIGFVRTKLAVVGSEHEAELDMALDFVQHKLFNCTAWLATPPEQVNDTTPSVTSADVERLEHIIDAITNELEPLDVFILPGGCEEACRLHVARTVTRRAERAVSRLAEVEPVDEQILAFINRLSDLLFTAARYANKVYRATDIAWDPDI